MLFVKNALAKKWRGVFLKMGDNLLLSLDSPETSNNDNEQFVTEQKRIDDSLDRSRLAAEQAVAAARSIQSSAEELRNVVDGELVTAQRRESHLRRSLSRQEAKLATKSSEYHALASQALATSSRLEQRIAESEEARATLAMELSNALDRIAELESILEGRASHRASLGSSKLHHCAQCDQYREELENAHKKIHAYETTIEQRTTAAQFSVEELANSLANQKRLEAEKKAMKRIHEEEIQRLQNEIEEKDALLAQFNEQLIAANDEVLEIHESQVKESKLRACGMSGVSDTSAVRADEENEVLKSRIYELEEETQILRNAMETDHQAQMEKADDINILRDELDLLQRKHERAEMIITQLKRLLMGISDVCLTGTERVNTAWDNPEADQIDNALDMTVGSKRIGFY